MSIIKKRRGRKEKALNVKQRKFVLEYVRNGGDIQKAYISAGYKANPSTARSQGAKLLAQPHIKKAVEEEFEKIRKKAEVSVERLIREVDRIALATAKDFYDEDGNLRNVHDLPDDVSAAIKYIEKDDRGLLAVKTWDKLKALELSLKLRGALRDDININQNIQMGVLVVPKPVSMEEWTKIAEQYRFQQEQKV